MNKNSDRKKLEDFKESFSIEQRAAILACFVDMAKSDGRAHPKELQLIEQARKLLGVELGDLTFAHILGGNKANLSGIISSLDRNQKEWVIAALHQIIMADGKVESPETEFMVNFCEEIGVSEFEYLAIVYR